MDVIFCADQNYIKFLPTVLNSISTHNKMNKLKFHLLHNIRNKETINEYKKYLREKYDSQLSTYLISKKIQHKNNLNHVTDATMLRLLIPKIINTCNKAIYLDLDVIVNVNLRKVLKINAGIKGISGKSSIKENVIKNMSYGKINPKHKTLNAGVLIMDLEKLKQNKFTEKCLNLVNKNPYNDQVVINLYLEGDYKELPKQYNIFNTQDDNLLLHHKEFILHYIGHNKPWNSKVNNVELWKNFEVYI